MSSSFSDDARHLGGCITVTKSNDGQSNSRRCHADYSDTHLPTSAQPTLLQSLMDQRNESARRNRGGWRLLVQQFT